MSEEEKESVGAVASEAVAQASESEVHDDRQEKAQEAERRKRNDAEYNWAESRRKMQELEKRTLEQQEVIAKLQKQHASSQDDDDLSKLAEDDILTVAQAKKLATKMAKSVAEEVVKQREASTVDERVQLKYADYAQVVTKENIELLKQTEPELAQSLYHMPDPYAQAVAAYKLIKKVNAKTEDSTSSEKKKALENSQKPVSVQAVTKQSAIGNAHLFENGLSKELKAQYWKEMQDAMKRA